MLKSIIIFKIILTFARHVSIYCLQSKQLSYCHHTLNKSTAADVGDTNIYYT